MRWFALTLILFLAAPARAQEEEPVETRQEILRRKRREKAENLSPEEVSSMEARFRRWEKAKFPTNWLVKGWRGIRPVFGGMPSGSGTVFGGGYIHGLENQYLQFQGNARFSTKGYKTFDAEATFPPPYAGRRIELRTKAEYRDLTSLRFFGLGNDSTRDDLTTYAIQDTRVDAFFWLNPRGLFSFGAQGGWLRVETTSGQDGLSIEEIFDPEQIGGFLTPRTDYVVSGGWVELDIRDKWQEPNLGVVFRATGERYEDRGLNRFDFTRFAGDLKAYVPLGYRNRILALRLRTSHATPDGGGEVPFYLMETLGGAKTIRGYSEWRFRDTRNLLVQAEYRWEVWTFVDFTLFFDAGKVFSDTDDFNFEDMHTGYGFGMRIHTPGDVALRFDLAKSTEGFVLHISGGPSF